MAWKNKNKHRQRILAIDPGTREMGIVVLDQREIVYYAVKSFRRRSPTSVLLQDMQRYISKLLREYHPQTVVVEKTFFKQHKNTAKLVTVANEIKSLAERAGLPVFEYAPTTVRKQICSSGKATKREVALLLCTQYRELSLYLAQDRKWKEKYWQNMFDALAVGLTHLQRVQEGVQVEQK